MAHDEYAARLKTLLKERRELVEQLKALEAAAEEHRKARDEKNRQVAELKQKRNRLLEKSAEERKRLEEALSELEEKKQYAKNAEGPYALLKRRLNQLEWEHQTGAQTLRREREMVKQIEAFEKQLTALEEFKTIEKQARRFQSALKEIYAEAAACHNALLLQAAESEKQHLALKEALEKMRRNREKIEALSEEAEKLRTQIPCQPAEQREKELRRRAEKILEDFKSGKKITVEELSLLERFNLY